MAFPRRCFLLHLLLWTIVASTAISGDRSVVLARPIPPTSHFGIYTKVYETLGVECKCCDGIGEGGGGECRSSWTGSCSKLQCLPWKFH